VHDLQRIAGGDPRIGVLLGRYDLSVVLDGDALIAVTHVFEQPGERDLLATFGRLAVDFDLHGNFSSSSATNVQPLGPRTAHPATAFEHTARFCLRASGGEKSLSSRVACRNASDAATRSGSEADASASSVRAMASAVDAAKVRSA